MSKLLLLVQSEADVTHLEAAAKAVLNSAITGVWCVFSPAITVNASEAASKLDGEIAQLRTAERAAADRSDYEAAAGYKAQREGKELDKAKALRDAWKTAPEEDRKKRIEAIFKPFLATVQQKVGMKVKITGHSDHYDREQWVAMLNSLTGAWFKEFSAGGFIVGWPESVEGMVKEHISIAGLDENEPAPKVRLPKLPEIPQTKSRAEELASMKHFGLIGVAKKLGIETEGKIKTVLIEEIVKAEVSGVPAAQPETVEAY